MKPTTPASRTVSLSLRTLLCSLAFTTLVGSSQAAPMRIANNSGKDEPRDEPPPPPRARPSEPPRSTPTPAPQPPAPERISPPRPPAPPSSDGGGSRPPPPNRTERPRPEPPRVIADRPRQDTAQPVRSDAGRRPHFENPGNSGGRNDNRNDNRGDNNRPGRPNGNDGRNDGHRNNDGNDRNDRNDRDGRNDHRNDHRGDNDHNFGDRDGRRPPHGVGPSNGIGQDHRVGGGRDFNRHDHTWRWSGYNHHSRRFLGIRLYDPFYFEWVYCGGRYYYWRGVSYHARHSRYLWDYSYGVDAPADYSTVETPGDRICFPAACPPLDVPLPAFELNPGASAPAELASHLWEPFYATLSSRLLAGDLFPEQRTLLERYQLDRDAELALLQRELAVAAGQGPDQARTQLERFAREQAPRLLSLEARAEALRTQFLRKGTSSLLLGSGDWTERREYYLARGASETDEASSLHLEYLLLRATAFYQDGLSRSQRELLREASEEVQLQAYKARGGIEEEQGRQLLYFSPFGTRLSLSSQADSQLVSLLQAFTNEKARLKQALVERLHALEGASVRERRASLEALARDQAGDFEELEQLAEEVRVCLARNPAALWRPEAPAALPYGLAARIDALCVARAELARDYREQFVLFNRSAAPAQVRVLNLHIEDPDPEEPPPLTLGNSLRMPVVLRDDLRARLSIFNEANRARHATLRSEQQAILTEITTLLRNSPALAPGQTAEALFEQRVEFMRHTEIAARFDGCRQAMLQPGLSLPQRRLLLGAALATLGLPSPGPE